MSDLTLVPIHGGALALGHRPKRKDLPELPARGVTHLVTLLGEREGAREIGDAATSAGLVWIWCPFANGQPPDAARTGELRPVLADLAAATRHLPQVARETDRGPR